MLKRFEFSFKELISGKTKGVFSIILLPLFLFLSWIFRFIVFIRNKLYDLNILSIYNPRARCVISIGSIVAGGTGKTPTTLFVAKALQDKFKLAILSRGYRSKAENCSAPFVLTSKDSKLANAAECGDEPLLIAQNLKDATVYVSSNRCTSAKLAVKDGEDILILEDGMQHRKLYRDFDIVVLDASNPFGFDHLLPRGLLREPPSALKRANMIFLHHVRDRKQFEEVKNRIRPYSNAAIVGCTLTIASLYDLKDTKIDSIENKPIAMLCGIAQPDNFRKTLKDLKANIVMEKCLPDHEAISEEEMLRFINECESKKIKAIVCTEKDKVKFGIKSYPIPIYWVKVDLEIVYGNEHWQDFMNKI